MHWAYRKNILLFIPVLFFLTSCVSTKRYTVFIKEKISKTNPDSHVALPDYIEIKTDSLTAQDSIVKVDKLKSFFIPAILYWQSEQTLKCKLDSKIPVNYFEEEFIRLADSVDLKSKLNGQKLELSILQIPNSFIYTQKETVVILLVAYAIISLEAIYPDNKELKIGYRILENGETKKTGVITIPNKEQPIKNVWKSTRKFTWTYLDQYRQNCSKANKEFFNQLIGGNYDTSLNTGNRESRNSNSTISTNNIEKHSVDLLSALYFFKADSSYQNYANRLQSLLKQDIKIISYEFRESKYKNGQIKSRGFEAKHKYGVNEDFSYKIGTWEYYTKEGVIEKTIHYDLRGRVVTF